MTNHNTQPTPRIIGLAGPAGAGKSTVARLLCEHHGFIELSFADPIRAFVKQLANLSDDEFTRTKEQPRSLLCGISPREAMQTLGTEWGRWMIGDDLWIRQLEHRLNTGAAGGRDVVISDVRFQNEADWLRAQPRGALWHLVRSGAMVNPHVSERGIALTADDGLLHNNCDLDELPERIEACLVKTFSFRAQ